MALENVLSRSLPALCLVPALLAACGGASVSTTTNRAQSRAVSARVREMLASRGPNAFATFAVRSPDWQAVLSGVSDLARNGDAREMLIGTSFATSETFLEALVRFTVPGLSPQHLASLENDVSTETKVLVVVDAPPVDLATLARELFDNRARHPLRGRVLIPSANPQRLILSFASAFEVPSCVEQARSSTTRRPADERAFMCGDIFVALERGAQHVRIEFSGEPILDPSNAATQNVSAATPLLEQALTSDEPVAAHLLLSRLVDFGTAHGAHAVLSAILSIPEIEIARRDILVAGLREIIEPVGLISERPSEVAEAALFFRVPSSHGNTHAAVDLAFHLTAYGLAALERALSAPQTPFAATATEPSDAQARIHLRTRFSIGALPSPSEPPMRLLERVYEGGADYKFGVPATFPLSTISTMSVVLGLIDPDSMRLGVPDEPAAILDLTVYLGRSQTPAAADVVRARARLDGAILGVRVERAPSATDAPLEARDVPVIRETASRIETDGTRCVGHAWSQTAFSVKALSVADSSQRRVICSSIAREIAAVRCADDSPATARALADLHAFGEVLNERVCAETPPRP